MKTHSLILIALACLLVVVSAQTCEPSTCPPGLVQLGFATDDCSGEPGEIYPPSPAFGYGGCALSGGSSSNLIEVKGNLAVVTSYDSTDCDESASWVRFEYVLGKCLHPPVKKRHAFTMDLFGKKRNSQASYSFILLANVNDTYVSPQPQSTINPSFPSIDYAIGYECYSVDNCTYNGVPATTWTTEYNSYNCTDPSYSYAIANISTGTCYSSLTWGRGYTSSDCVGPSASRANYFVGNGCEELVLRQTVQSVCGAHSYSQSHCTAQPPSDPLPPSSSSALRSSFLLIGLALIVAVTLLYL